MIGEVYGNGREDEHQRKASLNHQSLELEGLTDPEIRRIRNLTEPGNHLDKSLVAALRGRLQGLEWARVRLVWTNSSMQSKTLFSHQSGAYSLG